MSWGDPWGSLGNSWVSLGAYEESLRGSWSPWVSLGGPWESLGIQWSRGLLAWRMSTSVSGRHQLRPITHVYIYIYNRSHLEWPVPSCSFTTSLVGSSVHASTCSLVCSCRIRLARSLCLFYVHSLRRPLVLSFVHSCARCACVGLA